MANVFFTAGVKDQQQDKHEKELRTLVVPHISNIFPPSPLLLVSWSAQLYIKPADNT